MSGDTDSEGGIFHRLMSRGWFMQPKAVVAPLAPRSREKSVRASPGAASTRQGDLLVVLAQTDCLPELLQGELPRDWHSRTFEAEELRALIKPLDGVTVYDAALFGVQVHGIDADELKIFVKNLKLQWQADSAAEQKLARAMSKQTGSHARGENKRAPRKPEGRSELSRSTVPEFSSGEDTDEDEGNSAYFKPRVWRESL